MRLESKAQWKRAESELSMSEGARRNQNDNCRIARKAIRKSLLIWGLVRTCCHLRPQEQKRSKGCNQEWSGTIPNSPYRDIFWLPAWGAKWSTEWLEYKSSLNRNCDHQTIPYIRTSSPENRNQTGRSSRKWCIRFCESCPGTKKCFETWFSVDRVVATN